MAEIKNINGNNILLDDNRAFLLSKNINIFPCSRRGQYEMEASVKHHDPEARLNTERTNRLRTSINGFTDSFIGSFTKGILIFALAGYRIEVKEFNLENIVTALNISTDDTIYAHLSLHDKVPLSAEGYYTEILYRQSTVKTDVNYLDVTYTDKGTTEDFFVGVSFTKEKDLADGDLPSYNLPLFSYSTSWELVQTSLLPRIEHGTEPDSIKLGPAVMASLIVGEKAEGDTFTNGTIKAKEHIETPTLEATESIETPALNVQTIKNKAADGVGINDDLTVAKNLIVGIDGDSSTGNIFANSLVKTPTLNVNSITSDGDKVEINKPINVTGKATLDNGLEVTAGDVTIESNFNVADNINVGTPTTPATADNGGYIVAKKDITAEQDLIAKRNINVTKTATVESLVVGERTDVDSTEAGVITAKNLVKTPTLEATTVDIDSITSNAANGLEINPKTTINNTLDVEDTATLKNGLTVNSGNTVLKNLTVDNVTVTETNSISTPTLKVTTITSDATEVKVDKPLKVDSTLDVNNSIAATALQLTDIGQVPALEIANLKDTTNYQLRFKFGSSTPIKTVNSFTEE